MRHIDRTKSRLDGPFSVPSEAGPPRGKFRPHRLRFADLLLRFFAVGLPAACLFSACPFLVARAGLSFFAAGLPVALFLFAIGAGDDLPQVLGASFLLLPPAFVWACRTYSLQTILLAAAGTAVLGSGLAQGIRLRLRRGENRHPAETFSADAAAARDAAQFAAHRPAPRLPRCTPAPSRRAQTAGPFAPTSPAAAAQGGAMPCPQSAAKASPRISPGAPDAATLRRAMPLPVRSTPFACALPRRSAWVGCHPGFPRMPPARRPSSSRRHWARGCCSGQGCSAPAKQRRDGMPPRNSPCIQRHIVSAVRHDGAFPHSPPHIQTHAIAATRHGSAAPRSSPRIRRHLSAAARRCWALCSPVSPRGARSPSISPGGAGCHWASSAACCLAQPARRCTAQCARNRPPCAPFAA